MTPETEKKIKNIREVITKIANHKACTPTIKALLQNILFFVIDFKFEDWEHAREWLTTYDVQANLANSPLDMYPPIHPDYISLPDNRFEQEFKEIKEFFEFARLEMEKVGA